MGELFRSQEMQLVQLFFQVEVAHDVFDELGQLGLIQFKDLNQHVNMFQRHFVTEIKKAEEMERRVRFFENEIAEVEGAEDDSEILDLQADIDDIALQPTTSADISNLGIHLEELEKEFTQLKGNKEMLTRNYCELIELRHVLSKKEELDQGEELGLFSKEEEESDLWEAAPLMTSPAVAVKFGFVTGVVDKFKVPSFERVLWRATRGNLFIRHAPILELIEDPFTKETVEKEVFIVYFQGERAQQKVRKICESFGANLYPCPETSRERRELKAQIETRLDDLDVVLQRSLEQRNRLLRMILPNLAKWRAKAMKEKAIFHNMNMCNYDTGRRCLIAEGWCPKNAIDDIRAVLHRADRRADASAPTILNIIQTREQPPTYFPVNKFTASFQGIVDAYGMARYREVNPGVYTIISFPFMFGMMFGDIGHGLLLLLFALYLVLAENKLARTRLNEMVETCFHGRYLLLSMAICSIYAGFIYNECFAVPLNLFGSRWSFPANSDEGVFNGDGIAYPFGVDPVWKGASNELTFYNSLKMKLSVIFGVSQMVFGIVLSYINASYFKKPYNIYFEFIPQICFMLSTFGYMCFLIFLKWTINFAEEGREAPYLLNLMINMYLSPFSLSEDQKLFSGQLYIQWILIVIAFVSVPMMLLPKPLLLRRDHRKGYITVRDHNEDSDAEDFSHEEEFDFGEVFIHQAIHTIEFVLGAISNTASYLRLWALSLAHSELSTVFWDRVLVLTFEMGTEYSFIMPFIGFAIWAVATLGVLLVMESLSAFLHALRLHWVEFQNKFYMGDGYKFAPFSYRRLLAGNEEE